MTFLIAVALLMVLAPSASAELRGEIDPTFGVGGKVLFGLGPTYANSDYSAVVHEPDGSLLLAGRTESIQHGYIEKATFVQRRLPDGRLDPGFHQTIDGRGGYEPAALALLPDGDILYATGGEFEGEVRRLNPDGTTDTSYGKDGVVDVPIGPRFLAIDAMGRTVIGGAAGVGGNCHDCVPTPVPAVARLTPGGALDPDFGNGGTLIPKLPEGNYGQAVGLAVEPDDSIVLADERELFGVSAGGAPNPAFGHEGVVAVDGRIAALTETTDGDVIVAATSAESCCDKRGAFSLGAYRADGSLDPGWGSGGEQKIQIADVDVPTALAPGPDGTVVLAGETAQADEADGCGACDYTPYITRLEANGAVDPTFSAAGFDSSHQDQRVEPAEGYPSLIGAIAVLPEGGVALAGSVDPEDSSGKQASVTLLSASGSIESGFGTGGAAADPEALPSNTQATTFVAGPRGSLIASYFSNGDAYHELPGLGVWDADGQPSDGYGGGANDLDARLALVSDGRGRVYRAGGRSVRRLGVDGAPDPSYGTGGEARLPTDFAIKALVVRRSGVALAVGRVGPEGPMALFELSPSGHPDRHFGKRGLVLVRWGKGVRSTALSAAFDRRGRIVTFGLYGRQTPLVRLLPDGRPDPSFGDDGRVNFKPELAVEVSSVSVAPDGRIYLATSPEDGGETTLVRFREDGVRDRSFGTGGVVRIERAPALVKFLVGGRQLLLVSGEGLYHRTGFALRALRLDGDPDSSFAHGGVYQGGSGPTKDLGVIGAVREPNGDVVVAGTRRPHSYGEKLEILRFR